MPRVPFCPCLQCTKEGFLSTKDKTRIVRLICPRAARGGHAGAGSIALGSCGCHARLEGRTCRSDVRLGAGHPRGRPRKRGDSGGGRIVQKIPFENVEKLRGRARVESGWREIAFGSYGLLNADADYRPGNAEMFPRTA